jgi:hypothetical protein
VNEKKDVGIFNKTTGVRTVGQQILKSPKDESPQRQGVGVPHDAGVLTVDVSSRAAPSSLVATQEGESEESQVSGDGGPSSTDRERFVSKSPAKTKGSRREIDSVAKLIEYGYSRRGQRITVRHSELKQISRNPKLAEEDWQRLKELTAQDRAFAVPRQLLFLSRDFLDAPTVRSELREFVRVVLREHPIFTVNGLESVVQHLDGAPSLIDAFASIASTNAATLGDGSGGEVIKQADLAELCANVVGCLAVWSVETRGVSLAELSDALFQGFWRTKSEESKSEAERLRAITDIQEPVGVGLVCGEFKRRAEEHIRISEASRRTAETANAELRRWMTEVEILKASAAELQMQIDAIVRATEKEIDSARISEIHLKDDLETLRTRVLRRLKNDVDLLGEGLVALNREPPKVGVMSDHADRVLDSLKSEIRKLESGS